ncbi:MAG TPA: PH domain-containing protein [Blastocatellia bacterium]|nr:PH domain-containing protein [Blastocatellia bacterium]
MSDHIYCNQCGQALPNLSRFCNICGAAVVTGTPVARDPGQSRGPQLARSPLDIEQEHVIFMLRPTMVFVYGWYIAAAAVVIASAAALGLLSGNPWVTEWWYVVILVVGLLAFSVPVYKHILTRREVYTLTNFKLEMRYGLIAKETRNIPLNKIQDVSVFASVWQRFLRLGDIVIDSASETGPIRLDDISNPNLYADKILAELRRRN